jgi:hypothetical protein
VLNQDQGRDAIIALYANRTGSIPLIGSPSSAGPFNFGPWYFYLIMFWERLLPFFIGPWIGFTLMSVVSVIMYAKVGEIIAGKKGMVIIGLLSAVAYGPVINSPDMLNTVIVGFSSALAWLAMAKFYKDGKIWWAILIGLSVGWSINFHFQSLGLLSLLVVMVLVNKFSIIKRIEIALIAAVGLLTSFLPLIWFDLSHHLVWIKSVVEYYTVGVKKFYVPVRWLTDLKDFWPHLFGSVTVGIPNFGYFWLMLGIVIIIVLWVKKEKVDMFWLALGLSMLIQVILMRYYGGPRLDDYLIAFHGNIILITSWILISICKFNNKAGVVLLLLIMAIAVHSDIEQIIAHPSQAETILSIKKSLDSMMTDNVRIFKYDDSNMIAMPIFYLYYYQNRISENGESLGFCDANNFACPGGQIMEKDNYRVYSLDRMKQTIGFNQLTPKNIYGILMVNYGK